MLESFVNGIVSILIGLYAPLLLLLGVDLYIFCLKRKKDKNRNVGNHTYGENSFIKNRYNIQGPRGFCIFAYMNDKYKTFKDILTETLDQNSVLYKALCNVPYLVVTWIVIYLGGCAIYLLVRLISQLL